ncbi:DUF2235 domain-containing protein [uncultured Litoreibacter sp.]|uniref:phospholipase effector Tle1 domain-containing protein n=1 Tax=uncultured Litoreibacter sp. TaxID=1392394 RepID=UPI002614D847|nr:DUF2235 domain-containing protein [uncultured Litoreibacter sp.]
MNDLTTPNPQDAIRLADEAAAEVGTGDVGTTTVSCDVICIGVFFDGTNNSRNHVGKSGINWHTNVDFLEQLYAPNEEEFVPYKGQMRRFIYGKRYMRGIAVQENGTTIDWRDPANFLDGLNGGMRGMGDQGVYVRVQEAIRQVNDLITELSAGQSVCDIVLDVFGFSRGAAAARYFANQVQAHAITAEHGSATVRFLGLFDTVSSIYLPGQMVGLSDLPITTSGLYGTDIFHIIAADEVRYNFPSTRAYGSEMYMVGAHSDIGGGRYEPGQSNQGFYHYNPYMARGLHNWIIEKWGVPGNTQSIARNDRGDILNGPGSPLIRGNDRATFTWQAEHGLQNVSLRLMFDKAKRSGVPLPPSVPNTIAKKDTSLDSDLSTYYSFLSENGVCTDVGFEDHIRRKYAQFSGGNDLAGAMVLEVSGERRSIKI